MKKNVATQFVGVQMTTAADGSDFGGSVTCTVAKDGGTLTGSAGTGPTLQATGYYEYSPSQAETNADHIAFHFTGTGAISTTVQVYTGFPQTVDNNVLAAGATGFAAIDTVVDAILVDTATTIPATIATVDANVDAVLVDTGTTIPATIATVDANVDAILVDTATTIPAQLDDMSGATFATATDSLEAIRNRGDAAWTTGAGGSAPTVADIADGVWDELLSGHVGAGSAGKAVADTLVDTGTTIPATIATVDANVDAILVDTAAIGAAGAGLSAVPWNAAWDAQVQSEVTDALAVYDGPTNAEMEARTPTAAQLAYITANSGTGLPVTFTTAGGATTTAVLALVDGAAGNATNDMYNGRLLVFTDGTLKGCVTDITDYVGGTTTATITAIPFAPTASHNARLI